MPKSFGQSLICVAVAWTLMSCAVQKPKEDDPIKRSETLAEMGTGALLRGDYPQAIEDMRKSILVNAKNSKAHNNLGLAYLKVGQKEMARGEFQTAIDIDNSPDGHINLGTMAEEQQNYVEARRNYKAAADDLQYITRHRALTNMAELELKLNNIDEARRWLYQSIQANPDYCLSHFLLGTIYARENNLISATEEYKKSVRAACVANVEAHYRLAQSLLKLKQYDKARGEFTFLIEHFPETIQGQKAGDDLKSVP